MEYNKEKDNRETARRASSRLASRVDGGAISTGMRMDSYAMFPYLALWLYIAYHSRIMGL